MHQFDVFHGQLAPHLAKVYVRLNDLRGGDEWTIAGRVRGPECRYAKTLQVDSPLRDLGAGPTLLGCATVTDPCRWSPELPAVYRVEIQLCRGNKVVDRVERLFGFRGMGVEGNGIYWGGKRWVARGVHREVVTSCPLPDWREASALMMVDSPDDTLCRNASHEGVVLIALVNNSQSNVEKELQRLAQWPSVAMAVLSREANLGADFSAAVPNLLIACHASGMDDRSMPRWSKLAMVNVDSIVAGIADQRDRPGFPQIAVRTESALLPLAKARAECDSLQSLLAPLGDFAGYIVSRKSV